MTKKFLVPIGVLAAGSNPTVSEAGSLYYNNSDNKLYVYSGSAWVAVGGAADDDQPILASQIFG